MRPSLGRKIGQSGNDLVHAVFFSFFLHAALIALALFIIYAVNPKIYVPPFYDVKLVGLPGPTSTASAPAAAAAAPAPPPPKPEAPPSREPQQLTKKAPAQHVKVSPKNEAVPEFSSRKPKPVPQSSAKAVPKHVESGTAAASVGAHTSPVGKPGGVPGGVPGGKPGGVPGGTPGGKPGGVPGGRVEGVAVSSSSADFKFPPYLSLVRDKIQQNWNPPPGAVAAKAKVEFTVLRSGRVGEAKLLASSGNFYFDQAAVRAILMSSPLPPMPEGFYKDYAVFTVDLLQNE